MATRKDQRKARLLGGLIAAVVRVLGWTLRYRIEDPYGYFGENSHRGDALIWLLWHNRILGMPSARVRFVRHRQMIILTSASGDGEILAAVCKRFQFGSVRGSSSKRGRAALLALHRHLAAATDVIITPDGPRGPRYQMSVGPLRLAARSEVAVIPVRVAYGRKFELKTWDRFQIPWPFSKVTMWLGEKTMIDPAVLKDDDVLESERLRMQNLLGGDESPGSAPPTG